MGVWVGMFLSKMTMQKMRHDFYNICQRSRLGIAGSEPGAERDGSGPHTGCGGQVWWWWLGLVLLLLCYYYSNVLMLDTT